VTGSDVKVKFSSSARELWEAVKFELSLGYEPNIWPVVTGHGLRIARKSICWSQMCVGVSVPSNKGVGVSANNGLVQMRLNRIIWVYCNGDYSYSFLNEPHTRLMLDQANTDAVKFVPLEKIQSLPTRGVFSRLGTLMNLVRALRLNCVARDKFLGVCS
jgi:hypothetical protein